MYDLGNPTSLREYVGNDFEQRAGTLDGEGGRNLKNAPALLLSDLC